MRTVVESKRFATEAKALAEDFRRLDEILRGLTFVIAKNPACGWPTVDDRIWGIASQQWIDKSFILYYSFTATHVYLEALLVADEQD